MKDRALHNIIHVRKHIAVCQDAPLYTFQIAPFLSFCQDNHVVMRQAAAVSAGEGPYTTAAFDDLLTTWKALGQEMWNVQRL